MNTRYLSNLTVILFVLCSFLFYGDAEAVDYNVKSDSPVSEVISVGEDVTFDWHHRTGITQTKVELHTSYGTKTLYTQNTQYTWRNFPYGYGWWWIKVYKKGWFDDYKWYGESSVNIFHNSNPGGYAPIEYHTKFDDDGTILFFEIQKDYTIDITDYFKHAAWLPDCCEHEFDTFVSWAIGLPTCDWDFTYLEGNILTIKQGYRWDGASYPCKEFSNPCVDDTFNIRSSMVHDVFYDLMRMEYLIWDPDGWFCEDKGYDGHYNRKLADMLLYRIGLLDGQWKDGYFHAHNPVSGFGLKGRGAEPDWDLMRKDVAGGATCDDDRLPIWKYHVFELTVTVAGEEVELNWKRADDSGAEPASHLWPRPHHLNSILPHPGYDVLRDGTVIGVIQGTLTDPTDIDTSFTDDTVEYGETYEYQIRRIIVGSNNNSDFSNKVQITVTMDNEAPEVDAGPDETINEGETFVGSGFFTDTDSNTWTATVDYGDGSGDQPLILTGKTFDLSCVYAEDELYTVTVTVTDGDGGVGTGTVQVLVKENNAVPEVDAGPDETINEGDTFVGSGFFTDTDSNTWTATVDYGDESGVQSLTLDVDSFDLSHIYADNGVYTVTVEVADNDGGAGTGTIQVTVDNVAPAVDAGPDDIINEADTFTGSGSFTDAGADTWTATVDYGDGSGDQPLTLAGKTFDLSRVYADNGVYTVTVTVTDNDGGIGTETAQVTVNNIAPTASIDSMDQPSPLFILPVVHTLTFYGSFTDPGWLDTHSAQWDFGDGTVVSGILTEENTPPDSTGESTVQYAYPAPGNYTVTLNITDDDGDAGTDTMVVNVISPQEAVTVIGNCILDVPKDAFKNNADQRKKAFSNKLNGVVALINEGSLQSAIKKLQKDLRAKMDGSLGGNPKNDWITNPEAQQELCTMIDDMVVCLKEML